MTMNKTQAAEARIADDAAWAEAVEINRDWREYASTLTDPAEALLEASAEIREVRDDLHRYHEFYLNELAMADAQRDFTAACERTVAAGRCTGCEEDAGELIPWSGHERLCWRCVDLQLDLLALACGELWADAGARSA